MITLVHQKELHMATAKVIEIICEGSSIEKAIASGIKDAASTLDQVKQFDVANIQTHIEKGKIVKYRVRGQLTFVVEKASR